MYPWHVINVNNKWLGDSLLLVKLSCAQISLQSFAMVLVRLWIEFWWGKNRICQDPATLFALVPILVLGLSVRGLDDQSSTFVGKEKRKLYHNPTTPILGCIIVRPGTKKKGANVAKHRSLESRWPEYRLLTARSHGRDLTVPIAVRNCAVFHLNVTILCPRENLILRLKKLCEWIVVSP